jgi:hypothetical protein
MSALHPIGPGEPHDFPQPAADPVAFDGVADFLRNGKAKAHRSVIGPLALLQHESSGRHL